MSVREDREKVARQGEVRERRGEEEQREKAGNRETAGTLGHGGWIVPC